MEMDRQNKLKCMYNCVLAQAISDSGRYLFAGNRFGDLFVQDMQEPENADRPRPKVRKYPQGERTELNCMCFHRDFLVVGTIGIIYGLKWNEEKAELSSERSWEIRIPMDPDTIIVPDINFMWLRPGTDTLYAGCGDNIMYQISLEDGRITRDFRGHTDFIHGVAGSIESGIIYSASEDGTVRFWSDKQKESTAKLEPSTNTQLVRPEFGKWIGAVTANDDWLVCGGGPKCAMWHIRSMSVTRDFPFPNKVHVCAFVDDLVLIGGEHTHVQTYPMVGDLQADIPVEHTATYSVIWQMKPTQFMSIAGFSNKLHILSDFRFVDTKIDLYGNVEGEVFPEPPLI